MSTVDALTWYSSNFSFGATKSIFAEEFRIDQMRLNETAAGGEPAHGECSLQWRDGNGPLTDRNIESLGGIPRLLRLTSGLVGTRLPFARGNQARVFAGQIDSCPLAESHLHRVVRDPVDVEPSAQRYRRRRCTN